MAQGNSIFIGHAHKEKDRLEQLKAQLQAVVEEVELKVWDESLIPEALSWRNDMEQELQAAKMAIFLISPDFLASSFIIDNETPAWLKRAETAGSKIFWIASQPCPKFHPLTNYPVLNQPDQPLSAFEDAALDDEIKKISDKVAAEFRGKSVKAEAVGGNQNTMVMTEEIPPLSEEDRLELLRDLGLTPVDENGEQSMIVSDDELALDRQLTQDERFEGYLRHLMRNERFLIFFKELVKVTDPQKVKVMGDKLGITPDWAPGRETTLLNATEDAGPVNYEESLQYFDETCRLVLRVGGDPECLKLTFKENEKKIVGQSRSKDLIPDVDLTPYITKPYGVSRNHAQFWRENNRLCIQDMQSRNHTYINGEYLSPNTTYIVASGDKVRLGALLLVVHFEKTDA